MANKKRFIDANELWRRINERLQMSDILGTSLESRISNTELLSMLSNAPTVDAVEVVRCHKCKWYNPDDESCKFWPDEGYRDPEHFCGEGEIKDESSD